MSGRLKVGNYTTFVLSFSTSKKLGRIITSALPVATVLTRQRACVCVGACVCACGFCSVARLVFAHTGCVGGGVGTHLEEREHGVGANEDACAAQLPHLLTAGRSGHQL
jgi:hypothetical protein